MKKMLATFVASSLVHVGFAQNELIYQESFEDTLNFSGTYSSKFRSSPNDHFSWTDGANISNTTLPYSGYDGNLFWASEDVDHLGIKEQYLQLGPIQTAGYSGLEVRIMVAVGNEAVANGASGFDRGDSLVVYYSVDGGSSFERGLKFAFEYNGDAFNEPLRLDSDFDGVGDSTYLKTNFQEFSFPVVSAEEVILKIVFTNDADNEEIGIDNIRILGSDVVTTVFEDNYQKIRVSPNPFKERLKINQTRPGGIQITDSYGREWFFGQYPEYAEISTEHFPAGIYFVRLHEEARIIKVMKR